MGETATIRVSVETRDMLAKMAADEGTSVSALVTELGRREMRARAFSAERAASLRDLRNPEVLSELELWDSTLEDGVD